MPRRPRPIPAELGDSFSVRSAASAGVSQRRLRHHGLDRPFHGVRALPLAADPANPTGAVDDSSPVAVEARARRAEIRRLARAYGSIAAKGCFFSHVTAAVLWNLPLPLRLLRPALECDDPDVVMDSSGARDLDVGVLAPARASRAVGARGRQLSARSTKVTTLRGQRVTDPATTWALLGEDLTVDELVALGDAIVHIPRGPNMARGTKGLASIAELEAAIGSGRRRGADKLRAALLLVRIGSASPGETDLRLALGRAGLPEPELDFDIVGADGRPIGYTELAYPRWRLLTEYEGDHHRVDRAQWNRDIEKHAACVALGWEVIRLTAAHLYPAREPAVTRVREALLRAGWRP